MSRPVMLSSDNTVEDIDEVLSSTLGALYGRATPAVVRQAWEVLNNNYGDDVDRFKTEFLNPVLELLHTILEIQDTSDCPNSTWPLSVGSSVAVHLTKRNCRYLRDIGDFCISVDVLADKGQAAIFVCDLTFDGVVERTVDEPEFGSLLTMDWARRVREARDSELAFVLRQCMVASEYSVRHLRWDEIPQLDPRNLKGLALVEGPRVRRCSGDDVLSPSDSDNTNNSGLVHSVGASKDLNPYHISCPDTLPLIDNIVDPIQEDSDRISHPTVEPSPLHQQAPLPHSPNTDDHRHCQASSHPNSAPDLVSTPHCQASSHPTPAQDLISTPQCQSSTHPTPAQDLISTPPCQSSTHPTPAQDLPTSTPPHPCQPPHSPCPPPHSPSAHRSHTGLSHYGTWHGSCKSSRTCLSTSDSISPPQPHGLPHHQPPSSQDSSDESKDPSAVEEHSSSQLARRQLAVPLSISQVDNDLLCSGVAILPGCRDEEGRDLVYIFTCSSLWYDRRVNSTELARLLMYYCTVPRKRPPGQGLAIVADIRGATTSTVNILLESLYLLKDNLPDSVAIVHLFADKTTQSYVIKSPVYDVKANLNLKVDLTFDHLQQYVSLDQIPTVLEGTYPYHHESWVRFRKKLEPFMLNCRLVACRLVDAMQLMSSSEKMPQSVSESAEMIQAHELAVKMAFEDETLLALQSDGPAIISALRREEESFSHSEDYSFAMEQVSDLHEHLQDSISRLARLADSRMNKLHNCLQLREYEDECHKVIDWLSQDGDSILQRHAVTADNLRAVRHQQKEFEKFYYSSMSYIEKGNDLLEEASMLSQCGNFSEATGYKDLAKTLKRQLQTFTGQLEEARERIEGTAKCYHLLDKSYEWALEAMKYVSSMKMEHSTSSDGLDKLLKSFTIYLSQHPPISEDSFTSMLEAAQRLRNDKLLEQCRVAKARCQETHQLLLLRQTTLRRARNQMEVEQALKEDGAHHGVNSQAGFDSRPAEHITQDLTSDYRHVADNASVCSTPSTANNSSSYFSHRAAGDGMEQSPVWEPQDSSTPTFANWHGAGDGSKFSRKMNYRPENIPVETFDGSTSAQFLYPAAPSSTYSSDGSSSSSPTKAPSTSPAFVTLPVSPTLTTPEVPSRFRLYNSPPARLAPGQTAPNTIKLSVGRTISQPAQCVQSLPAGAAPSSRPLKKMLKRASTAPVPMLTSPIMEEEVSSSGQQPAQDTEAGGARERRTGKSVSMISGSSESLPSMPEEVDDLDMSPSRNNPEMTSTKDWAPVPVNTHLHRPTRGTPTGPMADLRLSEAEIKSRRTVSLIMSEMIQTERDYVRALQFITDHYVTELQREDVPQMLRGKRTVIFGNLEKIQQFHSQYFLKQLESCQNQPFLVGQYFLQHETMFYLYALYNKNKPKSDTLMMEYGKDFFRQKQLELGDKMDLSSYLLKPVQRMGKYALLLKQLVKECAETEPEYPELKAAEEMVKFQLRHGNDLLAMDSLRDCDVNLQEQGRLLRQEEFLVFQGRKKSMRRIFLFEDLILFSKTRRGRQGQHDIYIYKTSFKTADIGMTENYGDSGYKFEIWFRRRSVGENYVLQAPSTEVKKAWVKDISRLLWRQAIRNRETRINELATMGIGNKPCMDIKPSEDNIQDRSINISLNNRGARTRNSIAVSSFDYLRNGNKRPHSIISVSSTSSSGSSQSSFGLLGSLNLAFDPLDSPRMNRRSFASNESGIVADSETSGAADFGTENRGPQFRRASQGNNAPLSSMRSYFDVMKSRVLKQKYSDQVYTDV
ncbi:uncharacterized protein LOC131928602 isoform X2 [Physella acuta]|uniref:uncharacterized protein LOC131928602 isoform X2 n=1 Tax=Physella acuta TaxID=109671 RepID=UPI0027DABCCA|nr:uncharacterized protein LOC131928602 isoform X2 [Physella acuta]